ncbi:MAG: hypothetical protein HYY96_00700 [Candidatus Tectomicrobia bacterium]|nr:hypothetical protein [Candidatus Tectomicrobia bacterium]
MSFIATVAPERADGEIARVYESWHAKLGFVPNIIRAVSLRPRALKVSDDFRNAVIFGSSDLGRRREEMIATLISDLVRCTF